MDKNEIKIYNYAISYLKMRGEENMKKCIIYFIFLLSFFLSFLLISFNNKSNIAFELNSDNTYSIVSIDTSLKTIFIPEEYNDLPVTRIGNNAFKGSKIESLIIPDSILEIGDNAFDGCTSLINIFLSKNLKKIGNFAFASCTKIKEITFNEKIEEIGSCAFIYCYGIKELKIVDSITKIGVGAFMHMENLTKVTLSNSISKIEENTFLGCKQLESINIPSGVTILGNKCFYDCNKLATIYLPKSVKEIGSDIISTVDNLKIYYGGLESDYSLILNESKEIIDKYIICKA